MANTIKGCLIVLLSVQLASKDADRMLKIGRCCRISGGDYNLVSTKSSDEALRGHIEFQNDSRELLINNVLGGGDLRICAIFPIRV